MSYYDAASLASKGRGADTTLVHMSPAEVKGLQALAMAQGGSLTVNPSTGLPEAGFLSSILPMIGGAALTAMGVPLLWRLRFWVVVRHWLQATLVKDFLLG